MKGIKVKKLIELLKTADPERIVILQEDPDGNGWVKLNEVELDNAVYQKGEVYLEKLTKKLAKDGFTEEDVLKKGGQKCIVLVPTEKEYR